jgi:hypothetical protein
VRALLNWRSSGALVAKDETPGKNAADHDGLTPLHWAAKHGHIEAAQALAD